jgi:DNA-directed RNA polymerase specialized sigma24 family protein
VSLQKDGLPRQSGPWGTNVGCQVDRTQIIHALGQLSVPHRKVIHRAYYLRGTAAEIAKDLKVPEYRLKSDLHDAVRALRLILQGVEPRK